MLHKIYGVFGLMEYIITVMLGDKELEIPFTDGSTTNNGVRPATYGTSNPLVQYAIEHSAHFTSGRVKLLKVLGTPEKKPEARSIAAEKRAVSVGSGASDSGASGSSDSVASVDSGASDSGSSEAAASVDSVSSDSDSTDSAAPASDAVVEVTCVQDARQYLMDHFDVKSTALKSKAAINEYAAAHGITFKETGATDDAGI